MKDRDNKRRLYHDLSGVEYNKLLLRSRRNKALTRIRGREEDQSG